MRNAALVYCYIQFVFKQPSYLVLVFFEHHFGRRPFFCDVYLTYRFQSAFARVYSVVILEVLNAAVVYQLTFIHNFSVLLLI